MRRRKLREVPMLSMTLSPPSGVVPTHRDVILKPECKKTLIRSDYKAAEQFVLSTPRLMRSWLPVNQE